jgi:signal transduction histidine kinase
VLKAPEYFSLEYLPETRSELVIPLRIGEEVIGTLDVQSGEPDAFTPEDVLLIQSLGDQIAIAIENARLYKQSQLLAIVEERNRLARDMHDSVIQSLYSLGLLIEGWRQMSADGDAPALRDVLNRTAEINQQVLREMRLLIHELRPPILEKEGLVNALQKRLDAVENRAGLHTRLLAEEFSRLPTPIEEDLYRIATEALNNALKHSKGSQVVVRLLKTDGNLCLKIIDNGCGFNLQTAQQSGGMGVISMQERAIKMGASFNIVSNEGNGTTIQVCIPIGENDPDNTGQNL